MSKAKVYRIPIVSKTLPLVGKPVPVERFPVIRRAYRALIERDRGKAVDAGRNRQEAEARFQDAVSELRCGLAESRKSLEKKKLKALVPHKEFATGLLDGAEAVLERARRKSEEIGSAEAVRVELVAALKRMRWVDRFLDELDCDSARRCFQAMDKGRLTRWKIPPSKRLEEARRALERVRQKYPSLGNNGIVVAAAHEAKVSNSYLRKHLRSGELRIPPKR